MRTIYSHPKKTFQGIFSVSKFEILMLSLILSMMGMAVYSQFMRIYAAAKNASGGPKMNAALTPLDFLVLTVAAGTLYLIGVSVIGIIVKRRNARMNEQIDAARSAVQNETGLEIDHLDMSCFISYAVVIEPRVHTDTVEDTEHTLTFSAIGEAVVISCSSVVQRKTAPASLRLAMGNMR
jgi:hypothetical protein